MFNAPLVSVVVPVRNDAGNLGMCLDALRSSSVESYEVIVIDDASTDHSAEVARDKGAGVFRLSRKSGPAAARNIGAARAKGTFLLFIDSDVLVRSTTIELMLENLQASDVAAVFGSYDDDPAERNFLSQYKNLFHHFVHQTSNRQAETFWAGCGAVRQDVFMAIGGFDERRYSEPSIEDIELGNRLRQKGYQILLDVKIQVKHLKRWSLYSLLKTDIFCRAEPWSRLLLDRNHLIDDLNLRKSDRVSAGSVATSLTILPFSFWEPLLMLLSAILLFSIVALNYRLYRFFYEKRGLQFAILAFPFHCLYYFYSGVTFAVCWGTYRLKGRHRRFLSTTADSRSVVAPRLIRDPVDEAIWLRAGSTRGTGPGRVSGRPNL